MSKPLVSGTGKAYNVTFILLGIFLAMDIGILIYGFQNMYAYRWRGDIFPVICVIIGIGGGLYSLYKLAIEGLAFATKISVYEDSIKGNGQTSKFSQAQEFDIPISNIHNVDVIRNNHANKKLVFDIGIVVYTQHANYTCYMINAQEVRDKIMELIDAHKDLTT